MHRQSNDHTTNELHLFSLVFVTKGIITTMTRACPKEDQMTELITEARAIIIIIANMY